MPALAYAVDGLIFEGVEFLSLGRIGHTSGMEKLALAVANVIPVGVPVLER